MIRIIAGRFKGHKLKSGLDRHGFRPTKDRVKESLFSILGNLEGKKVLDIFAGSGNLGFEALSRGAVQVTFVENNFQQCQIIRDNAEKIHVAHMVRIMKQNGFRYLEKLTESFDLVLADPPYQFNEMGKLVNLMVKKLPDTQIVLETAPEIDITKTIQRFNPVEKKYGNTKLIIYKVENEKCTVSGDI
ncbi:MAG: 16S rRNA (guanine(966)-N(2))-methyltransferase RsmD [Candidatus Marinimicrobia bacterium]|nr:16S rRNA (guanine(966)-N(2))-methyltransferase RsmD [Candidatus Neomarinimicrobiota bacterium]